MTQIWRINLKTSGEGCQEFCLSRNLVGVGWPIEHEGTIDWMTYKRLAEEKYTDRGWGPALGAMRDRMQIGDLVWTRDNRGMYYLGRIESGWRYEGGPEYIESDVVNIRDCEWKEVGTVDAVPGKIVRSFIPRRTVQMVHDESVRIFSEFTWNVLTDQEVYPIEVRERMDIFSLISPEDCEDVVGCYLQIKEGYMIIPSSCKNDTMDHEYVLKRRTDGSRAVVQVKTGYVDLSSERYLDFPGKVFLFTTDGEYVGERPENVTCMERKDLLDFMEKYEALLPDKVQMWMRLRRDISS